MSNEMIKKLLQLNARVSLWDTGEKWKDKDGKVYNIDRKPINWEIIIQKETNK